MGNVEGWTGWSGWEDTSGDWLTLTEAAQLFSANLGKIKSIQDVLKAGYIEYIDVGYRLPVFVVIKSPVLLALSPSTENVIDYLVFAGNPFRLHPKAVKSLLLLNEINSKDGHLAVRTLLSKVSIDEWRHATDAEQNNLWLKDFECSISPDVPIDIGDVRIDREHLQLFFDKLNVAYGLENAAAAAPVPALTHSLGEVACISSRESNGVSKNVPPLPWIAAARKIFIQLSNENNKLTKKQISVKVRAEMEKKKKNGEPDMTGRGGKIPLADTILRMASLDLKT